MLERKETFRGAGSDGKLYVIENWTESLGGNPTVERREVYQTIEGEPVEATEGGTFLIPTTGISIRREGAAGKSGDGH